MKEEKNQSNNFMLYLLEEYKNYSIYRNTVEIDGLIPVERRILLTARGIYNFVKSAKIVGECMANFHPHSDLSLYKTLVKMVQQGFFRGQGNFGANGLEPIPPAAMRYTEVALNPKLKFVYDYIKYAPHVELEYAKEPAFFPVPFPLLLGRKEKIGVSFVRSTLPLFTFEALITLQKALLGLKTGSETIYPNFDNHRILAIPEDYLKQSEFQITTEIEHTIERNRDLWLSDVPPTSLLNYLEKNGINIQDFSGQEIRIRIDLRKEEHREYILNNLKRIFRFQIYRWNTLTGSLEKISLESLFLACWQAYCQAVEKKLEEEKQGLITKIEEYKTLIEIKKKFLKVKDPAKLMTDSNQNLFKTVTLDNFFRAEEILEKLQKELKKLQNTKPEKVAIDFLQTL